MIFLNVLIDMDYEDPIVDEDINWEDFKQNHADPVELMIEKVYSFKDKIFKKFKKSKEVVQDLLPGRKQQVAENF